MQSALMPCAVFQQRLHFDTSLSSGPVCQEVLTSLDIYISKGLHLTCHEYQSVGYAPVTVQARIVKVITVRQFYANMYGNADLCVSVSMQICMVMLIIVMQTTLMVMMMMLVQELRPGLYGMQLPGPWNRNKKYVDMPSGDDCVDAGATSRPIQHAAQQ